MRYTTDDMRNWAADEPDLGIGGVATAMREAADEIDRLRKARNDILDEAALAMDAQRVEIERATIATDKLGAVRYNPEQILWLKAAAIIRCLKT